ncbi:UDP-glucose 4-epimerase (plasmid) [Streptomyces sp. enrichment culture]
MTEHHTNSDPSAGRTGLEGASVLVTGGGGLIGSRIVARMRERGARPIALCTMDAYPPVIYRELFGVDASQVVTGDIRDAALVARLMREADFVVHAAALADVAACTRLPQDAIDHNVSGTQAVLYAAAASRRLRRLVFVSSASVYGNGNPDD